MPHIQIIPRGKKKLKNPPEKISKILQRQLQSLTKEASKTNIYQSPHISISISISIYTFTAGGNGERGKLHTIDLFILIPCSFVPLRFVPYRSSYSLHSFVRSFSRAFTLPQRTYVRTLERKGEKRRRKKEKGKRKEEKNKNPRPTFLPLRIPLVTIILLLL